MLRKLFPLLALPIFSAMLGVGIIVPLLPLYAQSFGATGIWLGLIVASFSISRAILMPIIGRLSDRKGRKRFILIGLLTYSIISLGYIWADSIPQLILIRLIQGVAGAMIVPIAQAYVGDVSPEGEEGKWMGYFNAAFFAGFGFGPLMGGVLTDHFGMTAAFYTMGGLNLLAFVIVLLFLPEIKHPKTAVSPHLSFKEIFTSSTIKGLFSFRLAYSTGRGAFVTFLPVFAAMHMDLSPTFIGILITVNIVLLSLLLPYLGKIADRFNRRIMVILGSTISIVFLALVPLTHSFWQLLGLCILGAFGGAISIAASSALTVDEGRKFGMGFTMAVFTMAMSIGMTIGPLLSGVVADFANINSTFYFAAAVGLAGTSLFTWFTR